MSKRKDIVESYSIGEVSTLLHLSRDMIRYYEKQGAIKASRGTGNNYRKYAPMEVFWLLEAMQHKSWGIPISDISAIRNHEYTMHTEQFLGEKVNHIRKDLRFRELLADRLDELRTNMLLSTRNIGCFWVENIPSAYHCHLVTGHRDEYEQINLSEKSSSFIFSDRHLPFFDNGLIVEEDGVNWEMCVQEKYVASFEEEIPDDFTKTCGEVCLCTHIDIGEIGSFKQDIFSVLPQYAEEHGFRVRDGAKVRGILLGRGYEDGEFRRIVKLFLPIL
jgi:DNA-binding transcriptional MerR regulator